MNLREVCMIFKRGKQPSAIDCLTHEKVAVVIVLLAINAAILAIRKTGQKQPSAYHDRNNFNSFMYKWVNQVYAYDYVIRKGLKVGQSVFLTGDVII